MPSNRPLHLLIVDDAPDNRFLLGRYVSKAGYTFETAENGQEAVDKALRGCFDLVLMDIQMPVTDGFDALRMLRAKSYPQPIVAVTAHAMKGDREICMRAGFNDYTTKPIHREELLQVIARNLGAAPVKAAL